MSVDRREFLGTALGAGALAAVPVAAAPPMTTEVKLEGRMAWAPATKYRPYKSKPVAASATPTWVQFDLGAPTRIDAVRLYPWFNLPGKKSTSKGFPLRVKIEGSDDAAFAAPVVLFDHTHADLPDPDDRMMRLSAPGSAHRYVRVTATALRYSGDGTNYALCLWKLDVLSGERNAAELRPAKCDAQYGNAADLAQLTRKPRPQGEGVITDNPRNVTAPATWHRPTALARVPRAGVRLNGGVFAQSMENNIGYLLSSFSVDEMLRPFRERAGKPTGALLRHPHPFWDADLAGSKAGRFLMGAGNTLRWREHAELRRWMDAIVDGIEECREPNGYIMGYPADKIFISERAGYTRAWVTHGLIEASLAGNKKALPLLRGYYDWFNTCAYLPELMRGTAQGVQGMVANTRMHLTSAGKSEDVQVIQRYYQENYWLEGLAKQDPEMVWQYPYDRPHNYLLTDFEAYMDLYLATGERRYLDAVNGAWALYNRHWEHVGGSIAITEFGEFPPDSYRLKAQHSFCETGELCGSSFWAFLSQRLQTLAPSDERYATEIEKSIYNVAIANQVETRGLMYHARLVGQKGDVAVGYCDNSCCEGQGTRFIGSIPEHIYSLADDGLYLHLYAPSTIEWQQAGAHFSLTQKTSFPHAPNVELTVSVDAPTRSALRIRVPSWAQTSADAPMPVRVNGELIAVGRSASYVTLDRTWRTGDRVEFVLPMGFRLTRYTGLDQIAGHARYALEYGPILMAIVDHDDAVLRADVANFAAQLKPVAGHALHFEVAGNPGPRYVPYYGIKNEMFTCFPVIDAA